MASFVISLTATVTGLEDIGDSCACESLAETMHAAAQMAGIKMSFFIPAIINIFKLV